jgi:tetratricopeptide (TPR) repeat protein
MKRWIFAVLILGAPAIAPAPAAASQFDVVLALQNLRAGRDGDALYWLTRAIDERKLAPAELADALEWRAYLHAKRRDRRAARADLDAAIAADKESPLRLRARARFFLAGGEFRAALADMEAVMSRSPSDAENYTDYCEALLGVGRRAEALDQCQRAIRVNPEHARAKAMLRRAQAR